MSRAGGTRPPDRPLPPREASHLLIDLFRSSLDPGYAEAAQVRAERGPRTGWRLAGPRVLRVLTLVVAGMLLAIAYQQVVAVGPTTSQARADLLADVRARQDQTDQLQGRADRLRDQVARQGDEALAGSGQVAALRTQAAGAGLGKVTGKGVVVHLADAPPPVDPVTGKQSPDNPGAVLDRDLQEIANALWRAGAEAIAINGQRLTSTATIRAAGGAILVDFRPITSPYDVLAIGPADLDKRFEASATARRFHRYAEAYRMRFSVKARAGLVLPSGPEPRLQYAHPPQSAASESPAPATGPATGTAAAQVPSSPGSPAVPSAGGG